MHNPKLADLIDSKKREDYYRFSQTKIAEAAGMSQSNFSTYLRYGFPRLSDERMKAIADYLGVEVKKYFPEGGEKMAYVKCPECGLYIPTIQTPQFEGKTYHRPGCSLEGKEDLGNGIKVKIKKK